jgi:L-ascorbate metabolism protein UlaG (beta-lactamase superfamily)
MSQTIGLKWLGTAGLQLSAAGSVLAVDPFFTRPGFLETLLGRPSSNRALTANMLQRCDNVLITHPHYDHLMDVPAVVETTGAKVYGSPNSCQLLALNGVPEQVCRVIRPGDDLSLDGFRIRVLSAEHRPLFGMRLAIGPLQEELRVPLRATDYRMDECFSFEVLREDLSLVICSGTSIDPLPKTDVLLVAPYGDAGFFAKVLAEARPRLVIPNHWDDFMRPLSKAVRMLRDPSNWLWPPLRRVDLDAFAKTVSLHAPQAALHIPKMLEPYDLAALLLA